MNSCVERRFWGQGGSTETGQAAVMIVEREVMMACRKVGIEEETGEKWLYSGYMI